jgi:hypothetical protein
MAQLMADLPLKSEFARVSLTSFANRTRLGLAVGRILPAYVIFAVMKHLLPLRWLVRLAWQHPVGPRDREVERRAAANVWRLSQLAGLSDHDCLQRSLVLYRLLSRAAADPRLVVGLRRSDGCVEGHVWVIVDGHAVSEPDPGLLHFWPVLVFGWRGKILESAPGGATDPLRSHTTCGVVIHRRRCDVARL